MQCFYLFFHSCRAWNSSYYSLAYSYTIHVCTGILGIVSFAREYIYSGPLYKDHPIVNKKVACLDKYIVKGAQYSGFGILGDSIVVI